MAVTVSEVTDYMARYIATYRDEYEHLTAPPPQGGGYPKLSVSPYISTAKLQCLITADGVAIVDLSGEPDHAWWIAGGPALMADFPDSRTPSDVAQLMKERGLSGKPIGIYRVVSETGIPDPVWRGEIGPAAEERTLQVDGTTVLVQRLHLTQQELLQRLTFGALGLIVDIHLPTADSDFWTPHIIRSTGFFPADRHTRRFVNYLELSMHLDSAAWDQRAIATRVQVDIRRDFAWAFSLPSQGGGTVSFGRQNWTQPYRDRLLRLRDAIEGLSEVLAADVDVEEDQVHQFLLANPILLDVYGQAISKPRLPYPEGESPLGKKYVEPDFIIRYPGSRYKLVELERPAKRLATAQGQPRAEVTQSTFQIAEWRAYIANHYDVIRTEFPGISTRCSAMVVIGRSGARSVGEGRDEPKYQELLRSQFPDVDILTYDDLLDRARVAYVQLASLGVQPTDEAAV